MPESTPTFGFPFPVLTDIPDGPAAFKALAEAVDAVLTSKRLSTSVVAAEEARENAAYGLMPTPDKVEVTVPQNALVEVTFEAVWKESVAGAARAAIFVDSKQLTVPASKSGLSATEAACTGTASLVNQFARMSSANVGLICLPVNPESVAYEGDTAGGHALAAVGPLTPQAEINGVVGLYPGIASGACIIAGITEGAHTISVRCKASSGKVTVKERRLSVKVLS